MPKYAEMISFRATSQWLAMVDTWRSEQSNLPSRADAIRELTEIGLASLKPPRRRLPQMPPTDPDRAIDERILACMAGADWLSASTIKKLAAPIKHRRLDERLSSLVKRGLIEVRQHPKYPQRLEWFTYRSNFTNVEEKRIAA